MDRMLYVAMTGAQQTLRGQAMVSHNLANANTVGFRQDLADFRSMPVFGDQDGRLAAKIAASAPMPHTSPVSYVHAKPLRRRIQ